MNVQLALVQERVEQAGVKSEDSGWLFVRDKRLYCFTFDTLGSVSDVLHYSSPYRLRSTQGVRRTTGPRSV